MNTSNGCCNGAGRTSLSDEALVAAARTGDKHALAELLDRWYPAVRSYLTWRSGDRDLAADLTHDVLLRAAERVHQLARNGAFSAWLYQIARNRLADAKRRQRRLLSLDWVMEQSSTEHILADPASSIAQWVEDELIEQAFVRLSDEAQEVLHLHDVLGYSVKDIGVMMDLAPMTIYQRLHRGRHAFRRHYEELNRGPEHSGATQVADGAI